MDGELLSTREAAHRLGIASTTLYDWLGQSDRGLFAIRGMQVTINYYQGGQRGQGRIRIESTEIERLKDLMRVKQLRVVPRLPLIRRDSYPGIHVKLGRPSQRSV